MRTLLLAALLVAAVVANNCSSVLQPSSTTNYYMPPKACVDSDSAVRGCFGAMGDCLRAAGGNGTCAALDLCFAAKMRCLEGTKPLSANCTTWASGLENFGLYLTSGGAYEGSSLDNACRFALCRAAEEALNSGVAAPGGLPCNVNIDAICVAPSFEAPTRGPRQAEFTITFGGDWAPILRDLTPSSPKYREIATAAAKGLAKLLAVLEHLITITELRAGSLIVTFIVNDATVTAESVRAKVEALVGKSELAAQMFEELSAAGGGIAIDVTGIVVSDYSTPAPTLGGAAQAMNALVMALFAVVAAVAML